MGRVRARSCGAATLLAPELFVGEPAKAVGGAQVYLEVGALADGDRLERDGGGVVATEVPANARVV